MLLLRMCVSSHGILAMGCCCMDLGGGLVITASSLTLTSVSLGVDIFVSYYNVRQLCLDVRYAVYTTEHY